MRKQWLAGFILFLAGAALGPGCGPTSNGDDPPAASPDPGASAAPADAGDAEGVIFDALRRPDAYDRAAALATLLPTLGPDAVPEAVAAVRHLSRGVPSAETILLMRFWATHEPKDATDYVVTRMATGFRVSAIEPVVEVWASQDPETAIRFMAPRFGKDPHSAIAEIALVRGWFASGHPGLEDYVIGLGTGFERQRALSAFLGARIQRDGAASATSWVEALPEEDKTLRTEATTRLGQELGAMDPAAAQALCEKYCEGPFGMPLRRAVAASWAEIDGPAAMDWLSRAPDVVAREGALAGAFHSFRRQDRQGLHAWLEATGPESLRAWFQHAMPMATEEIARVSAKEALPWAASIDDDKARELALIRTARHWREQDEPAAEAWLRTSPLSEESRALARQPGKRVRRRAAAES